MPRRLFIECTYTTMLGFQTGVQRVVRSLCREGLKEPIAPFAEIIPIAISKTGPRRVPYDRLLAPLPQRWRTLASLKHKVVNIAKWLGRNGLPIALARGSRLPDFAVFDSNPIVEMSRGDVLLLPDAYWANRGIWSWASAQRDRGVTLAVVVYDLIPHVHPENYGERGVELFRDYLRQVAAHADLVLTISNTVAGEIRREFPVLAPAWNNSTPVVPFPLGAELGPCRGSIRPAIRACFDVEPAIAPLLMVGTIEIRKNHAYALDALDLLWSNNFNASLCILGEVGWQGDSFLRRARAHPEFGTRLRIFHAVNDRELRYAYSNSRGVLFTSSYEGFGLPMIESLLHGKPTFVSDTPIHREVGGEHVVYCDINDPQQLAKQIWNYSWGPNKTPTIRPGSWKQSLNSIVAILSDQHEPATRTAA